MTKQVFVCNDCGSEAYQWAGRCTSCGAWNSLSKLMLPAGSAGRSSRQAGFAPITASDLQPVSLADIVVKQQSKLSTGIDEFDRVLGGGLIAGAVVLIGGDPGVGKSTLLLQTLSSLSANRPALYVTAEESLQQIATHATRMGLKSTTLTVLAETSVEAILAVAQAKRPECIVIDSIQTVSLEAIQSAPGSVSQVRESALRFVHFAKNTHTVVLLVGHVTKEGALAGPRVLEHMVDTVLYFEGERDSRWRLIRSVKNRFGAVNELGVFAMTEKGLKTVNNPSALFLSRPETPVPGSAVMVAWEGTRPMLVEVQALADFSCLANPRRLTIGWEAHRLAMLLAVLHRHGHMATHDQDIFINIVGGLRITETAADLALLMAIVSSLKNHCIPQDWVILGEVGLGGEVRPIPRGNERLQEAAKHGFKQAIIPYANIPAKPSKQSQALALHPVRTVQEALERLLN